MEIKSLTMKDELIYFLNDDNEIGYGMYLAAAYQNFIIYQKNIHILQEVISHQRVRGMLNILIIFIK